MTPKRCKVTRLDDTFLRVDAQHLGGALVVRVTEHTHHRVYNRFASEFESSPHASGGTVEYGTTAEGAVSALLATLGLTTDEPRPETAEDLVRAWAADASAGRETDWLAPADLRAILAELDRLRDAYDAQSADLLRERRLSDDLKSALRMPGHGSYVEYAKEVRAEIDRLRAQRQVDVDAVLAPVRDAVAGLKEAAARHESARLLEMEHGDRKEEAWHSARAVSYESAARRAEAAIAEAENIARGE